MSTNRPDEIDGEVISRQMTAAEQLPMGMQLLRMENEQIMSLARVAPRDPAVIVSQLKAFLQAYPAAALEAIYAKPVGSVYSITCKDCRIIYEADGSGPGVECTVCGSKAKTNIERRQKYAEGLSIRAAETIRSVYGFTRLAVRMSLDESGKATIEGTLVDYAAGNMTSDERVVTPFYKSRDGDMRRTPEDRFLNVVVKAEKSKLRRDLILDSVPAIVKAVYRDECEAVIDNVVPEDFVNQKILPQFQRFGVTKAHLEQLVGAKVATGWTKDQTRELSNLLNGLKSGDTNVAELLAPLSIVTPGSENDPTKAARGDALAEINAKRRAAKAGDQNGTKPAETAQKPAESAEEQQGIENAPSEPQDGPRLHSEPEAEPDDSSDPGELPEPYSEEERRPVIDKLLAEIESAVTKKRMDAIAGKIHNDPRLSDVDLNDLVDKISAVSEERGLN